MLTTINKIINKFLVPIIIGMGKIQKMFNIDTTVYSNKDNINKNTG